MLPDRISQEILSVKEKEYFTKYTSLLTDHIESIGFDITADLEVYILCVFLSVNVFLVTFIVVVALVATKRSIDRNTSSGELWRNHDRKWSNTLG